MITPVQRLALLGAVTTAALGAGAWALRPMPLPEPSPASAPLPVKPGQPEIVSFNPPGREESFKTDPFSGLMGRLGASSEPTAAGLPSAAQPAPAAPQTVDIRIPVLGRTVPVAVPNSIPVGVEPAEVNPATSPVTAPVTVPAAPVGLSGAHGVGPVVSPLDRVGNVAALDLTSEQAPVVAPAAPAPAPAPLSAQARFEQQLAGLQLGLETVALGQTDTAVFSVGGEFLVVSEGQPIAETGVIAEEISMRGAVLRKGDARYVIDLRFPPPAGELTSPEVQP